MKRAIRSAFLGLSAAALFCPPAAAESTPAPKSMTRQGDITGSGGFSTPMGRPNTSPEAVLPASDQAVSARSTSELAKDSRAPDLRDAVMGAQAFPMAELDAYGRPAGDGVTDGVRANPLNLLRKSITRFQHRKNMRSEGVTREKARVKAVRYKKEVDASKINNDGDDFYETKKGLWETADKLYNLSVGWIKN
ncbi:MAG: hypothetical protein HYZ75_16375 [Elusimicrobia bacterium]|nr:hypothetical protein [Elusimicrobiota bacterium]